MNGIEKVVKYLEIQSIVNQMANNSFLLKGWNMTLVVAVPVLMAKYDIKVVIQKIRPLFLRGSVQLH